MKRITITIKVVDAATPTVVEPEGEKVVAAAITRLVANAVSVSETTLDGFGPQDLEPPEQLVPNFQQYADANGVELTYRLAE